MRTEYILVIYMGCVYLIETFGVTRKTIANFPFIRSFGGRQRVSMNYSQAVFCHNQSGG